MEGLPRSWSQIPCRVLPQFDIGICLGFYINTLGTHLKGDTVFANMESPVVRSSMNGVV